MFCFCAVPAAAAIVAAAQSVPAEHCLIYYVYRSVCRLLPIRIKFINFMPVLSAPTHGATCDVFRFVFNF